MKQAWAECKEGHQEDKTQPSLRNGSMPESQARGLPGERFVAFMVKGWVFPPRHAQGRKVLHLGKDSTVKKKGHPWSQ